MEKDKFKTRTKQCNDFTLMFESDVYNGETLDTKVFFNGTYVCWIAGNTIEQFTNEFEELIRKYRI